MWCCINLEPHPRERTLYFMITKWYKSIKTCFVMKWLNYDWLVMMFFNCKICSAFSFYVGSVHFCPWLLFTPKWLLIYSHSWCSKLIWWCFSLEPTKGNYKESFYNYYKNKNSIWVWNGMIAWSYSFMIQTFFLSSVLLKYMQGHDNEMVRSRSINPWSYFWANLNKKDLF